jgi:hypothetical protein
MDDSWRCRSSADKLVTEANLDYYDEELDPPRARVEVTSADFNGIAKPFVKTLLPASAPSSHELQQ